MNKSEIGNTGAPVTMPLERGKIREFARAIKDNNPLYFDAAYATQAVGGIMPPPTFSMTSAFWEEGPRKPLLTYDVRRLLHGEQEFEYLAPIYAGDVLTGTARVTDVYEKKGGTVAPSMCMNCFRCVEMCPYESCLKVNVGSKTVFKSRNWLEPSKSE